MATFIGTIEEFNKFLGGYCRNKINLLTKKHKGNICEYCGGKSEIEAAHLCGKERVAIIKEILSKHINANKEIEIDLHKFEDEFIKLHSPIKDHFHFLCADCHRKYDKGDIKESEFIERKKEKLEKALKELNEFISKKNVLKGMRQTDAAKFYRKPTESIQDYVKRLLKELDSAGLLSDGMIQQLKHLDYCRRVFGINYPLLEKDYGKIYDPKGHCRYWKEYKFRDYYVCSQWWKSNFNTYEVNLKKWVGDILLKH